MSKKKKKKSKTFRREIEVKINLIKVLCDDFYGLSYDNIIFDGKKFILYSGGNEYVLGSDVDEAGRFLEGFVNSTPDFDYSNKEEKLKNKISDYFEEWTIKIIKTFNEFNNESVEYSISFTDWPLEKLEELFCESPKPGKRKGCCRIFYANEFDDKENLISHPFAYIKWDLDKSVSGVSNFFLLRGLIPGGCPEKLKKYFRTHLFKKSAAIDKITNY